MMGTNRQFLFERSLTQNTQSILEFFQNPLLADQLGCHCRPFRELIQGTDIQDGEFLGKDIVEAPLRKTPIKRHLPPFKSGALAIA